VAVGVMVGGNRRKPLTCRKSMTNFITTKLIKMIVLQKNALNWIRNIKVKILICWALAVESILEAIRDRRNSSTLYQNLSVQ
jgi:hypothetical protein